MAKKTDDTKRTPITERELPEYLLWRYNLGGYDDNISAWRSLRDKEPPTGNVDTKSKQE